MTGAWISQAASLVAVGVNVAAAVMSWRRLRTVYELGLLRGIIEGRLAAHKELAFLLPDEVVARLVMNEASARDVCDRADAVAPRWARKANERVMPRE